MVSQYSIYCSNNCPNDYLWSYAYFRFDKHSLNEPRDASKVGKVGYRLGPQITVTKEDSKPANEKQDSVVWDDFTDEEFLWNCADQADELLGGQKVQEKREDEKEPGPDAAGAQFRTARGSAISVSKEGLDRARKIWLEDTE